MTDGHQMMAKAHMFKTDMGKKSHNTGTSDVKIVIKYTDTRITIPNNLVKFEYYWSSGGWWTTCLQLTSITG